MTNTQTNNPAQWAGFTAPEGHELGWKVVRPDGRTYGDFRWPFSGQVSAAEVNWGNHGPCPSWPGDGMCIAKTWRGTASGGITAITGLALTYRLDDVLGEDVNKLRVSQCCVVGVLDLQRLIREGYAHGAGLRGASLCGAGLRGASLCGANLCGANLCGANLCGANLCGANLCGAYLCGAYLRGASLCGANLCGANLRDANLRGACLCGGDLRGALNIPEGITS